MHKIITKKYIKDVVRDNLSTLNKGTIESILLEKSISFSNSSSKENLISLFALYKIDMWEIYHLTKKEFFGVDKETVKCLLNINDEDFKKLKLQGFIETAYHKLNGMNSWIEYFSLESIYNNLTVEKLQDFLKSTSINKLDRRKVKFKTSMSNQIVDLKENQSDMKPFLHCGQCLIMNIKYTGKDPLKDEIISFSLIDPFGNIIYSETFNSRKKIRLDKYNDSSLTRESLNSRPFFKDKIIEISLLINNKCVISYDSEFDKTMLIANGYKGSYESVSLMDKYRKFIKRRYILREQKALNMEGISSDMPGSLGRCFDYLALINKVITECDKKINLLSNTIK